MDDERLRLSPTLVRALRGPTSLQLGCGPHASILDGLEPADWRAVTLLERGTSAAALLADARRSGSAPGDEERAAQLLGLLDRAGALVVDRHCPPHDVTATRLRQEAAVWTRARADPTWWAGTGSDRPADDPVGHRYASSVAVVGGGGLGAGLAAGFAASGVGTVALVADLLVAAEDVVPGGPTGADLGRRLSHVAAEAVHRVAPEARTACPADPDLVVLVAVGAVDSAGAQRLVQSDTAHLSVLVREDDVVVGPVVRPGSTACLHCLDLHRSDADPGWPELLRQLVGGGVGGVGGGVGAGGVGRGATAVPALGQLAVGLAVLLGLAQLDGRASEAGTAATASLPHGVVRWSRWAPHPRCGCVGLPDPGASPGATMAA